VCALINQHSKALLEVSYRTGLALSVLLTVPCQWTTQTPGCHHFYQQIWDGGTIQPHCALVIK
jgi:hypothetical protein